MDLEKVCKVLLRCWSNCSGFNVNETIGMCSFVGPWEVLDVIKGFPLQALKTALSGDF